MGFSEAKITFNWALLMCFISNPGDWFKQSWHESIIERTNLYYIHVMETSTIWIIKIMIVIASYKYGSLPVYCVTQDEKVEGRM